MKYLLEDLGVQARSDIWLNLRHGREPGSGQEVGLAALARGGFFVIWPESGRARQVWSGHPREGWGIGQAPDGTVYQSTYGTREHPATLFRWDWQSEASEAVIELPGTAYFTLDVGRDGKVYLPEYGSNMLYAYNPASGELETIASCADFGDHVRNVCCGQDGWVYATVTDYQQTKVVAYDPATGALTTLDARQANDAHNWQYGQLVRDGADRVLIPRNSWGRTAWFEVVGGQVRALTEGQAQLARSRVGATELCSDIQDTALAFADGSYVSRLVGDELTIAGADGTQVRVDLQRRNSPLRIFSIAAGGGRIWGGTFIPLTLFAYDCDRGETSFYDNPTRVTGEIYNLVWSADKLFMASYTNAELTRFDPRRPWQLDETSAANPAQLGRMKADGRPLQRPHGKALAPDGAVFFAAHGSYGCLDSGITRIDPHAETLTRWLWPETDFHALCYLTMTDELLVAETRQGEDGIRFTFISPESGEVQRSEIVIADQGDVISWLPLGDLVYGMHAWRATVFAYSLSAGKIVQQLPELAVGDHCHNALMLGPDDRIWGLTNRQVYSVDRDLSEVRTVCEYEDHAGMNFYRFGMATDQNGYVYFPNGTHLMRIRAET